MRAITISVDYADYLAVTLPYNRHHFEDMMVVTSMTDDRTVSIARQNDCQWLCTDAFYRDGATFNKWIALEEGLDALGREGWIAVIDADILWPRKIDCPALEMGNIYGPAGRRMWTNQTPYTDLIEWAAKGNSVDEWGQDMPRHPTSGREVAGYTQIFHASDQHLGEPPWYETNWRHAGGADSFFPRKWPEENRIHLPFEVLHLGESGQNWHGRCTPYLDGTEHPEAEARRKMQKDMLTKRRKTPRRRRNYEDEKL